MREVALVVDANDKTATIELEKKDECSKCGMCLFPKNAKSVKLKAENVAGAKAGDKVIVESSSSAPLISSLLVFLVPLALIGVSMLINHFFIKKEIWIVILSVIFIAMWYTILAGIDKKLSKKGSFKISVVEILKEN